LSFVVDRALYGQKTQSRACVGEPLPLEDERDGRPQCANTGHSQTLRRTGQVDPKRKFPTHMTIGPLRRKAVIAISAAAAYPIGVPISAQNSFGAPVPQIARPVMVARAIAAVAKDVKAWSPDSAV
jgi:hypothetical protein